MYRMAQWENHHKNQRCFEGYSYFNQDLYHFMNIVFKFAKTSFAGKKGLKLPNGQ